MVAIVLTLCSAGRVGCDRRTADSPIRGGSNQGDEEVAVAAAADLRFALEEVEKAFATRNPQVIIAITYGSSGQLFAQLSHGAPFDLFLSADVDYPRRLIASGLAWKESEFQYAVGRLVIWVPMGSPIDPTTIKMDSFAHPGVGKIAIANPAHAPYGRAAESALKRAGVYERVKDRLVWGENVAQAAQFVESGAADIGVISLSLALVPAMKRKGTSWELPRDLYPPIEQGGVILERAKESKGAVQFREFMLGAEGRAILARHGLGRPDT